MIKYIAVDLGGVYFKWSFDSVMKRLAKETNRDEKAIRKAWLNKRKELYSGRMSREEYTREFSRAIGRKVRPRLLQRVEFEENKPNKPLVSLLKRLRRNYRLCVISNISENLYRMDREFHLSKMFEFLLGSIDAGEVKPNRKFWTALLKRAKCKPNEILIIDDNPRIIAAARKTGFAAIQYKNTHHLKRELKLWGVY